MLSFIPTVVAGQDFNSASSGARPGAAGLLRLRRTARRVGRAAVETVLFLGVGGAMAAGALLFR
jgi:hypothetical protein